MVLNVNWRRGTRDDHVRTVEVVITMHILKSPCVLESKEIRHENTYMNFVTRYQDGTHNNKTLQNKTMKTNVNIGLHSHGSYSTKKTTDLGHPDSAAQKRVSRPMHLSVPCTRPGPTVSHTPYRQQKWKPHELVARRS